MPSRRVGAIVAATLAMAALLPGAAGAVVSGRPVAAGALPFLAFDGGCTGTLIAPDRLLTAAHCVQGQIPALARWWLGAVPVGTGRELRVADIALHPSWDWSARGRGIAAGHDVAILRLDPPVTDVPPLTLAGAADAALTAPGAAVLAAGWGGTQPAGTRRAPRPGHPSPVPHEGDMTIVPRDACAAWYRDAPGGSAGVPAGTLCAGDPAPQDGRTSPCNGDSGGPLLAAAPTGGWTTVGVFSSMHRCGADGDPAVYTAVAAERPFIDAAAPAWAPAPITRPVITGSRRVGGVLRCGGVRWTHRPTALRHRWAVAGRLDNDAPRARSPLHTVTRAERGRRLTCVVLGSTRGGYALSRAAAPARVAR
jgi:secreted trypsin-like serine protease